MKKINGMKGFTLIELLVVVVIIAVISGVILTSLISSRSKARDGKRISDIAQIQLALEQYYDRCQIYPEDINVESTNCSGSKLGDFISTIPVPPQQNLQSSYDQFYFVSADGLDYSLRAVLENPSEVVLDGLDSNALDNECSNAPGSLQYCVGPK